MGRKSALTAAQWEIVGKRYFDGESASALAREFGITEGPIRAKFKNEHKTIKTVANQIVAAEQAFSVLPIKTKIETINLADHLLAISGHLASGSRYGAATYHRLQVIANAKSAEIDDARPMDDESRETLKDIMSLTRVANESAAGALNLIAANKVLVADINSEKIINPDDESTLIHERIASKLARLAPAG